jgi:hypothetical protein
VEARLEKVAYALWRPEGAPLSDWAGRLVDAGRREFASLGLERLKLNVPDVASPADDPYAAMTQDAPEAMVSGFLNSALLRGPLEQALNGLAGRIAGYSVVESTVLPATAAADGTRSPGFAQVCFFARRPDLTREQMLDIWLGSHTQVAVETQSTFYYNQNIVLRPLTPGAPGWDCIVEESFPGEALADSQVYFDAKGSPQRLEANLARMNDSCGRFIDFTGIKMLRSGEYRFGGWSDPAAGWREATPRTGSAA